MTDFLLPGPSRHYPLPLNLALVEVIEQDTSLLQVAESLAARSTKLSDIVKLLLRFYALAGCDVSPPQLEEFILQHSPATLLADILLQILSPLKQMGAATPGKT